MADAPGKDWQSTLEFYRRLIDDHGWSQEPMRQFVIWLASGPQRSELFPSTSHEALGLSMVRTYEERLTRPMVYVVFERSSGFVVHWQEGQGHTIREESVLDPADPAVFRRILDWLGIRDCGSSADRTR